MTRHERWAGSRQHADARVRPWPPNDAIGSWASVDMFASEHKSNTVMHDFAAVEERPAPSGPASPSKSHPLRSGLMKTLSDPSENRLIAALTERDRQRWLPQLEPVELRLGQALYESGDTLSHVFFPTTAIVSLLYVMENGASAEIAVVGNEGLVGISLFMGGESTTSRAVVQSAGEGYRLPRAIKEEFKRAPVLHLLLRYTQALITQMAQTAVCNRRTRSTSSSAAGCCSAWTACRAMSA